MKLKALGIVRRLDGLGRVVIPMEVRKTQGWDEGTAMEFYMAEEGLVMKQYHHGKAAQEVFDGLEVVLSDADDSKTKMAIAAAIDFIEGR